MRMGGPCEVSFPGSEAGVCLALSTHSEASVAGGCRAWGESGEKICGERGWCGQEESVFYAKLDGKAIAESA